MEAEGYLETLLVIYQATGRHISEYKNINNHRFGNLKSHFFVLMIGTKFATINISLGIINYKIHFY